MLENKKEKKVNKLQKQKREEDERQNERKKETRDPMTDKRKNDNINVEIVYSIQGYPQRMSVRDDCTEFIEFCFTSILSCI